MVIKWMINSIAAVNANNRPGEVAAAMTTGIILAFIPAGNLTWVFLLGLTFFLKINFGLQMIVIAVLKPLAFLADPVFDSAGYRILTLPQLEKFFTSLYNMPVVPLTGFNNTVLAGSVAIMALLALPLWIISKKFIALYREKIRDRFLSSKIVKKLSSLPLVSKGIALYSKAQQLKRF